MPDKKGLLIIISGPSGAGKGTLCRRIVARNPDIYLSVSVTTRAPRPGEVEGVNYFFRSKQEFREMIDNGQFLEYAEVFGNYYGTPKKNIEDVLASGRNCILEIEVQGAMQVMKNAEDCVSVFIIPPSVDDLEARLKGRGSEDEASIRQRLEWAGYELGMYKHYDYMVVNDQIDRAVEKIESIISAESLKTEKNHETITRLMGVEY